MSLLAFDDRDGQIWMNGQLKPWRDCKTHILTHGLHYGSAVFEGNRSYGGKVFKLEEHTERLFASAALMDMKIPFSQQEINEACHRVLEANNIGDGYLRPVAWRGSEMMAVSAQNTKIHVAIAAWSWPAYFKSEAISLGWAKYRRPSPESAPVHAKAAGLYMICTLSKHECEKEGFDDALMLDFRGQVAEATGANVFFVKDGELHTPIADCFLNGITRRTVIGLARDLGITVNERVIMPEDLADMQECFLVGTAVEVKPVARVGDYHFQVGDISNQLVDAYSKLVRA